MCGGGGDGGAAAQMAEQRRQEEERQAAIRQGQSSIDENFKQYGDDYYNTYKDSYTNYYYPQLDDQYARAKDKLVATLAGRDILESSVGADALSQLLKNYNDNRTQIGNQSVDAMNAFKGKVEKAKTDLYSLNSSSADPQAIAARAAGEAAALASPTAYSPLASVFTSTLQPFSNYLTASNNSANRSSPSYTAAGSGSGTVVR